ncbi:Beta-N-acetylhexosaminidase [compost metagenome]
MATPIHPPAAASMMTGEHLSARDRNVSFPWTSMSPAVLHAKPEAGADFVISESSRILIDSENLRPLATRLAAGLAGAAGLGQPIAVTLLPSALPLQGDVSLQLSAPDTSDIPIPVKGESESYRIDISSNVLVSAQTPEAMSRALTTLHKAVRVSTTLESGVVIDAPMHAERSVMIDMGRWYFSPDWVINLIQEMAWNQLNTLHLHLTDNEGVRVTFPSCADISSSDAWSAEELKRVLDTAASYHIEVIPELDMPGHMDWILRDRPEFQLRLSNGTVVSKALDFSLCAARSFITTLVSDLFTMFPRSRRIHLGADEFFLSPITHNNTPQLAKYAREMSGNPNASSEDAVRYFINDMASLIQDRGKIARVWNDGAVRHNPVIAVDKKVEIECWSLWGRLRGEMTAQDLINAGYNVINAHGDFYFIINNNWDNLLHDKHSPRGIYDTWQADHFMDEAGGAISDIPADSPFLVGAGIQFWIEVPSFSSPEEAWNQLVPWLLPLGQRTWDSPNGATEYKSLSLIARAVAHPPPEPW